MDALIVLFVVSSVGSAVPASGKSYWIDQILHDQCFWQSLSLSDLHAMIYPKYRDEYNITARRQSIGEENLCIRYVHNLRCDYMHYIYIYVL